MHFLPDGLVYVANSALNPMVIRDDSGDEYEHPPVILRQLDTTERELAWDIADLRIMQNKKNYKNLQRQIQQAE